jgi:uncharacterized protein with HEPN domain
MKPDDRVRLEHIKDALTSALRFTQGRRREDLDHDEMLTFALARAIEIVGEAASKISAETRDRHPDIPWADIIGMRHRLVHAYIEIDRDILWSTAMEAGPEMLAQVNVLLETD